MEEQKQRKKQVNQAESGSGQYAVEHVASVFAGILNAAHQWGTPLEAEPERLAYVQMGDGQQANIYLSIRPQDVGLQGGASRQGRYRFPEAVRLAIGAGLEEKEHNGLEVGYGHVGYVLVFCNYYPTL